MATAGPWETWLGEAVKSLEDSKLLRSLRPIATTSSVGEQWEGQTGSGLPTLKGLGHGIVQEWRSRYHVPLSSAGSRSPLAQLRGRNTGEEVCDIDTMVEYATGMDAELPHKLLLFSGNDYLNLSVHPAVCRAAAKAALEFGMGPRASALVCGYTYHHRLLESALADLKETEDCLLCPSGFAANMAVMTALTSVAPSRTGKSDNVVAIFSDALNHASIIDGARVAQKQSNAEVHVYRHNDMAHLHTLLSNCKRERKVVVTDSLFSMDGDFALLVELVALRRQHGFVLVIDEAHGTLVCGENGGGVAEAFGVQHDIDIHVGTLSKAIGCHGGFIASSRKWKQLIQSRGRSFIFSTALPVPVVAAAHAALVVAREEKWRQRAVWDRVQQLSEATGLHFTSPIAPIIMGNANVALDASRQLLIAGFHVSAIRPPTVPLDSSRLRITLSAGHSAADVEALVKALPLQIKSKGPSPSFLPTPVRWLPSSLVQDLKGRESHGQIQEHGDKLQNMRETHLIRPKL